MALKGNWSVALADTIIKRYPDPDTYPYRSWCYPQGFMLWGMAKLWETTGDRKYYGYILKYADEHVGIDGSIRGFSGCSLDDVMAGSILVWAYLQTREERYRLACKRIRKVFDTYPRLSDGGFWHGKETPNEIWVDGLFMGQMFLTKYGSNIAESGYCFDEAARQLASIYNHCRKDSTGLLYHAWSEDRKPVWANAATGLSPEVWSEGLGWYAMILVETLEVFPEGHPCRSGLLRQLAGLLESLRDCQDEKTGLWNQVVDKGYLEDNWHDTSGSAMFVYAVKKAIELGFAEPEAYSPVAERGYQGIITKARLNESGLVDIVDACDGLCVQKSYSDYISYNRVVNAKEAVAAFLWAAWIMERPGLQP